MSRREPGRRVGVGLEFALGWWIVDLDDDTRDPVLVLTELADRLDELASTAALMGDEATSSSWRAKANELRLRAMSRFDD